MCFQQCCPRFIYIGSNRSHSMPTRSIEMQFFERNWKWMAIQVNSYPMNSHMSDRIGHGHSHYSHPSHWLSHMMHRIYRRTGSIWWLNFSESILVYALHVLPALAQASPTRHFGRRQQSEDVDQAEHRKTKTKKGIGKFNEMSLRWNKGWDGDGEYVCSCRLKFYFILFYEFVKCSKWMCVCSGNIVARVRLDCRTQRIRWNQFSINVCYAAHFVECELCWIWHTPILYACVECVDTLRTTMIWNMKWMRLPTSEIELPSFEWIHPSHKTNEHGEAISSTYGVWHFAYGAAAPYAYQYQGHVSLSLLLLFIIWFWHECVVRAPKILLLLFGHACENNEIDY